MSSLASLCKRVSIRPIPWRERKGKKGVPVRMNSDQKTSRVAIKTASRQIKKQKKSHELEFKLLLLLASSRSKREEHFEISTTQTYTVNSRGLYFSKALFERLIFGESCVHEEKIAF